MPTEQAPKSQDEIRAEKLRQIIEEAQRSNREAMETVKRLSGTDTGATASSQEIPPEQPPKKIGTYMTPEGVQEDYDENGELWGRKFPDGTWETYHWNGKIRSRKFLNGIVENYDGLEGKITSRFNAEGNEILPEISPEPTTPADNESAPTGQIPENEPLVEDSPIPQNQNEEVVVEEIKNIPEADREKLGWGLNRIGYNVEKMKDDFFAKTLNLSLSVWGDKKGTTGRFITELKNSFVRDAKEAEKKGLDIQEGKNKGKFRQIGNVGLLTGNVLKYGRIVADITGLSIANPLRWTMLTGMAVTRGAEAGKEARFKSDKLLEKTQIKDAEKAAEEAWRIYEKAGGKIGDVVEENGILRYEDGGVTNIPAEALKNAYLNEMPRDLQERLKDPTVALNFVQKITRKQIEISLNNLQIKMNWLGHSHKKNAMGYNIKTLSDEQIEIEKQKLLKKWEKKLNDYDRMITQYGTVDELAMGARYLQTAGKGVVLAMQIETAFVSLEKMFGAVSHMFSHSDIHETLTSHAPASKILPRTTMPSETHTTETPLAHNTPPVAEPAEPVAPPAVPTETSAPTIPPAETADALHGAEVTLSPKGYTQTILDLKAQLTEEYGTPDKMPPNLKIFFETPSTKLAQEYGFWDIKNGTSAMGYHGETLSVDADGHLALGHLDGNSEVLDTGDHKFSGKMFTPEEHPSATPKEINHEYAQSNEISESGENQPATENLDKWENGELKGPTTEVVPDHTINNAYNPTTAEEIRTDLIKRMPPKERDGIWHKFSEHNTPPPPPPKLPIEIDEISTTGRGAYGGNRDYSTTNHYAYGTNTGYRTGYGTNMNNWGMPTEHGQHFFPGLSENDNLILNSHPEFADNPFHLTGAKLIETYKVYQENMHNIFRNDSELAEWNMTKDMKVSKLLGAKEYDKENPLMNYLHELQKVSKLKPKSGIFHLHKETVNEYIMRALQKVTQMRKLNKFRP